MKSPTHTAPRCLSRNLQPLTNHCNSVPGRASLQYDVMSLPSRHMLTQLVWQVCARYIQINMFQNKHQETFETPGFKVWKARKYRKHEEWRHRKRREWKKHAVSEATRSCKSTALESGPHFLAAQGPSRNQQHIAAHWRMSSAGELQSSPSLTSSALSCQSYVLSDMKVMSCLVYEFDIWTSRVMSWATVRQTPGRSTFPDPVLSWLNGEGPSKYSEPMSNLRWETSSQWIRTWKFSKNSKSATFCFSDLISFSESTFQGRFRQNRLAVNMKNGGFLFDMVARGDKDVESWDCDLEKRRSLSPARVSCHVMICLSPAWQWSSGLAWIVVRCHMAADGHTSRASRTNDKRDKRDKRDGSRRKRRVLSPLCAYKFLQKRWPAQSAILWRVQQVQLSESCLFLLLLCKTLAFSYPLVSKFFHLFPLVFCIVVLFLLRSWRLWETALSWLCFGSPARPEPYCAWDLDARKKVVKSFEPFRVASTLHSMS